MLYGLCNWCGKQINSFNVSSGDCFCSATCKNYYTLELYIINIMQLEYDHSSIMEINQDWHILFDFLFKSDLCLYAHRRDDIAIELAWLYQIYLWNINGNLFSINSTTALQHLSNFLYFLRNTHYD